MRAGSPPRTEAGPSTTIDRILLALILLTLPWEVTKRLFPVEWLEVSRLLMVVALGWLSIRALRVGPRIRVVPLGLTAAVLAVVVVELGSYAVTRWPNAPKEIAAIGAYALVGVFAAHSMRTRAHVVAMAAIFILSGLIVGGLGIAEQLGDFYLWKDHPLEVGGRRNATFADPNITARFLVLALIAILGALAVRRPRRLPTLLGSALLVVLVVGGLVFTLSRTGWLIGALIVLLWLPVGLARRLSGSGALLAVATFVVVIVLSPNALRRAGEIPDIGEPLPPTSEPFLRPATTTLDPLIERIPLDDVRRYLLRAGVAMFEDAPLAGVGLGGFQPKLLGPYRNFIPPDRRARVTSLQHVEVVRIASEMGIVGLVAFAGLLGTAWWGLWRAARGSPWADRVIAYALALMLLVIVLSSQSEGRFYTEPYLWLVLGSIAAFIRRGPGWAPQPIPAGPG